MQTILKLRVPVIVRIGHRKMPLGDVLALGPGAIVELSKHADENLDLLVTSKPIGTGSAVKIGENFGLRLSAIGTARERIEALAGDGEGSRKAAAGDDGADAGGEDEQETAAGASNPTGDADTGDDA